MQPLLLLLLAIGLGFGSTGRATAENLPEGFVDIRDVMPDIQMEIRYYTADNFVGQRIDGYNKPKCIITTNAATALEKVQKALNRHGLGLKIYDCYRPQRAVDHFVRWAKNLNDIKMKARYYPNVDKKTLFKDGYIAEKSGHSRGSTVDLSIVAVDSDELRELDMGTGWDFFGPESWPDSKTATPAQRAHRMLLQTLMVRQGFTPYHAEWWHFTLADEPFPNQYFDFSVE